jgi:hypothetical protein
LTQKEVSEAMNGYFQLSAGILERENKSTNGEYYVYSIVKNDSDEEEDTVTSNTSSDATNDSSKPLTISAIVKTGPNSAVVGDITNYTKDFLESLDENLKICFTRGKNNFKLTNTMDKFEARKLFKTGTGEKHNDVRIISIKTYLKRLQAS